MNPYSHNGRYVRLFKYTVRPFYYAIQGQDQFAIHKDCYKWVNRIFTGSKKKLIRLEPGKLFLLEAADPKRLPTQEEFDNWMEKRELMQALRQ